MRHVPQACGMVKVKIAPTPAATPAAAVLTDEQLAAELAVEPRTLRLWRHCRGLPFVKITPRVIRYRRADIDAWLARRRVAISTLPQ